MFPTMPRFDVPRVVLSCEKMPGKLEVLSTVPMSSTQLPTLASNFQFPTYPLLYTNKYPESSYPTYLTSSIVGSNTPARTTPRERHRIRQHKTTYPSLPSLLENGVHAARSESECDAAVADVAASFGLRMASPSTRKTAPETVLKTTLQG
jgi:hypothetical protein